MTREEAIKIIDFDRQLCNRADELGRENGEALDMAIKALEQEPCEDCISREEAISIVDMVCGNAETFGEFRDLTKDLLRHMPSVQPARKKGRKRG